MNNFIIYWRKMDPRLYIYELRRPRVTNPTFNSNHINNTCFSIYSGGPLQNESKVMNNSLPQGYQGDQHSQQLKSPTKEEPNRSRASSNLSNYGSSLMKLQDKDIYRRQNQRYNIISMEPLAHQETIKKYPKFTLQDKDAYYFRKMIGNDLQKTQQQQIKEIATAKQEEVAGVHTYEVDSNKVALNVWDSYGSAPQKYPKFSPKMLNHADQFRSLI